MKKWLVFFPAFLLLLGGCAKGGEEAPTSSQNIPTSSAPTSVEPPAVKHTVRFLVGDQVFDTQEVVEGEKASYPATLPTKAGDAQANKYGFAGWDNDLSQPITADLDVHGSFGEYADGIQLLDDFESYTSVGQAKDNKWEAVKQENSQWSAATGAIALSLSSNAGQGSKALRFDTARNACDYGIMKKFDATHQPVAKYANAIHFRLMYPCEATDIDIACIVFHLGLETKNGHLDVTLKHDFPKSTSEYFECTIPFRAEGWKIWNDDAVVFDKAAYYGFDAGKIPTMLDDMIFFFKYKNKEVQSDPSYPAVYLDDVSFVTLDDSETAISFAENNKVYNRYTGTTVTNNTVRIDITDATHAVAHVLDTKVPQDIPGTYVIEGNKITFTSDTQGVFTYEGEFTNGRQKIKCTKVDGAMKDAVGTMDLNAVQVVENFESYSGDGTGYCEENKDQEDLQLSGLRGAFYSEYYDGSKWALNTNANQQIYLKSDSPAHSGSKFAAFKGGNTQAMRYLTWDLYKGTADINSFRGTTLSFWAKAKASTQIKSFKVYAVSKSNGNFGDFSVENYAKVFQYSGSNLATDGWQHFTIPLKTKCIYYGFAIMVEKNYIGDQWLHIDDIEVYTADPYAEYREPVSGVELNKENLDLNKGASETLVATVAPNDAYNKAVTWTSGDPNVATVDGNGQVTGVGAGSTTITVTTVDGSFTDTCTVNVSVVLKSYPEGTYKATVNMGGADHLMTIALGNETNGLVNVFFDSALDAVATGVTWTAGTKTLVIATTGEFSSAKFGNITATFDPENDKLTNITFDGTISAALSGNGTYEATNLPMWDCDGTSDQLKSLFKRRWGDPWQTDSTNDNRFTSNTTEFVSGTGSVTRRGYSGGRVAMAFNSDFNPAKTVSHISFWVYNPSASNIAMRMWRYTSASLGGAAEVASSNVPVAKAGQWTYVERSFTNGGIYNFQIADFTNSGVFVSFDNIALF